MDSNKGNKLIQYKFNSYRYILEVENDHINHSMAVLPKLSLMVLQHFREKNNNKSTVVFLICSDFAG